MFVVVSYDVTCDRRRNSVAETLAGYGARVQFSVFECHLTAEELEALARRVAELVDVGTDRVRFYALCARCVGMVRVLGRGSVTEDRDFFVV